MFGYATAGSLGDPSIGYTTWNFNLLSTVAFFAIHVQNFGELVADSNYAVWSSSTLTGLVNTAHAHGTKVVVTVVGPSDVVGQCDALYYSLTTVDQIVAQVVAKGIDGVNIDYEGERAECSPPNTAFLPALNQDLLTAFVQKMRAGLDAVRPGYYLSISTYSGSAAGPDGYFNIPALNPYVDSFFVMAYDMDEANQRLGPLQSCTPFCMAPVSPLANYYWNDTTSMAQYSAVVGPGKTILGQPYYGRVACVPSPVPHAASSRSFSAATYFEAASVASSPDVKPGTFAAHTGDSYDPSGLDRWDTWYDLRLGCWREMYWSDVAQLGARYDLVNRDNLRGVGLWTLNYGAGAPELWSALDTHFVRCMGASVSASPSAPQPMGTIVQLTAASMNCGSALYQFWVLAPGSTRWQVAQAFSSSPTLTWDTASRVPGTYLFSIWARESGGAGLAGNSLGRWDSYATTSFNVTSVPETPCTSVNASSSPVSPQLSGSAITISTSIVGCANPRYAFWHANPGSSTWQLVQPFSTQSSYSWNTLGSVAGVHRFSVWVRDASSFGVSRNALGSWDAFSAPTYTLTTQPCGSVSALVAPSSPQLAATPVTVTATATGCPAPRIQFWLLAPGSAAWKVLQPYSLTSTWAWNTAGYAPGTYTVAAWARDTSSVGTHAGGLGTWDALTSFAYTLTSSPCMSASATTTPPGSAPAGSAVTINASTSGCPSPQYQFWMLAPGSQIWQDVQPYSSSATYNWASPSSPGTYAFIVWIKDPSSLGLSGNYLGRWDSYAQFSYVLS